MNWNPVLDGNIRSNNNVEHFSQIIKVRKHRVADEHRYSRFSTLLYAAELMIPVGLDCM